RHDLVVAHQWLVACAHHQRHAWSVDVGVEQPDRRPRFCQRNREVDRDRRFADPTFAGGDGDRVLDPFDRLRVALAGAARTSCSSCALAG
ncbi:MAG TPA: hypothetical protein VK356_08115, partial [Thermomicrobiales bacterium]|nr:hypothetical protein [Thermomicrobiales bacterium]